MSVPLRPTVVEVAGAGVAADVAEPTAPRPKVVIVTESWGSNWGEHAWATRLIAGALALRASVRVVSIDDRSSARTRRPRLRHDGLFPIHSVAAPADRGVQGYEGGDPGQLAMRSLHSELVRAAITRQPGSRMPEAAAAGLLDRASLPSPEALAVTVAEEPDVVVLAGLPTAWMASALPVGDARPRVVLFPMCGDDPVISAPAFRPVLDQSDAVGALSNGELRRLGVHDGSLRLRSPERRLVRLALPVNRLAAAAGMAGVTAFGRYVLVISGFDSDPAAGHCPPHDYLRQVIGDVAIAEVRRGGWMVTGGGQRFDMTWAPTRMNVWRLMARADVTIDVRSQGPVGRDAIESLLFGTPVVVPEGSVAAEHAAEANAGLWYRDHGEMADGVRHLLERPELRASFSASGAAWAEANHGDTEAFVASLGELVLGGVLAAQ